MNRANHIKDDSKDWEYFVVTPQLVWALSKDPFDYILWNVIKMIAGEKGECFLSTEDLAALAMMSPGKASESREHLIGCGLIEGEIRQDPGYPQPVWHLRIPDIWTENIAWRKDHQSLKGRIEYKKKQRSDLKAARKLAKATKHKSLQQVKPSAGEDGLTSDEDGLTSDETKNNHKGKIKKQPAGGAVVFPQDDAGLFEPRHPDLTRVTEVYRSEITRALTITSMEQDKLEDILTGANQKLKQPIPLDWLEAAIAVAVEANKRRLDYVVGILKRWVVEGKPSGEKDKKTNGHQPSLLSDELAAAYKKIEAQERND